MCGIVGYIGKKQAKEILLSGLSKLEYRGYDSAGIAVVQDRHLKVCKSKGRLRQLQSKLEGVDMESVIGIGHTRWATHGEPSDRNSHPHTGKSGRIALVHNGIIENYMDIKEELMSEGYLFSSDTDTEVAAQLVDKYYFGNLLEAVKKTTDRIRGSYAFAVVSCEHPDEIIAARKDSPLIVGLGENENYIASDIPAILEYTRDIYLLEEGDIALLKTDEVKLYNSELEPISKEVFHVDWDVSAAEKGGFEHFMLKEIHEEPSSIRKTLQARVRDDNTLDLGELNISTSQLRDINKIFIIACGSAYHAGLIGKSIIESWARIPVEVDIASEFRYRNPIIDEKDLAIIISQSGETADSIAALRECKQKGAKVVSIVNVVGSTIARESDEVFYTWAGPEIAVATTKGYVTQVLSLYMIALDFGHKLKKIDSEKYKQVMESLQKLPDQVAELIDKATLIHSFASFFKEKNDVFYLGRGLDFALSMEGSLKLKEVSYMHSEAYAAGELKHGTIALIEKGTPIVAIATQNHLFEKTLSNIKEVKARGANVLAIATERNTTIEKVADHIFYLPKCIQELAPILAIIPLQLLGYFMAVELECDVDKPRNLAKSVTVE